MEPEMTIQWLGQEERLSVLMQYGLDLRLLRFRYVSFFCQREEELTVHIQRFAFGRHLGLPLFSAKLIILIDFLFFTISRPIGSFLFLNIGKVLRVQCLLLINKNVNIVKCNLVSAIQIFRI